MAKIDDTTIQESFESPRMITGDQGSVTERSIAELILADQYLRKRGRSRHNVLKNSIVIAKSHNKASASERSEP